MVQEKIIVLIGVTIMALIAFALLPELMNSGEQAKSNENVTETQGVFMDLVGLFLILNIAFAAFVIGTTIGVIKL